MKNYGIFYGSVPDVAVTLTITAEGANNYKVNYRLRTMTAAGVKSSSDVATDFCNKEHFLSNIGHGFSSSKYWFLLEKSGDRVVYWAASTDNDRAWYFGSSTLITSLAGTVTVYYAPIAITLESAASSYCSIRQESKVSDTMVARTVNVYVNGVYVGKQSGTHYFPVRGDIKSSDLSVSPKSGWILDNTKGGGTGVTASGTTYNVYLVQQYQVTGSIDHGTVTNASQTVNHGSSNAAMTFTPASNYVISGVTVNGSAVSGWSASSYTYPAQTITEKKTVVVTTANKYTVAYNGNGSTSGNMGNQSFIYGTAQNLRANAFSRVLSVTFDGQGGTPASSSLSSSSTFLGWASSAGGSVAYSNAQSVNNLTTSAGATVTMYAKWSDQAIVLPAATKTGGNFLGWYTSATGGTRAGGAGDSYTPSGTNTVLYARWSAAVSDIIISRSGLSEGESAIYSVSGGGQNYTVVLTGPDASVTLKNLPDGVYTVTETSWGWSYQTPSPQTADITGGHTFQFTASKKTSAPVSSESSKKNW